MLEVIFLFVLAFIWVLFAVVQDLKTREIANWINFSLIIFALIFRFIFSLFSNDFAFLYQGLIGLGIFFVIGNALYYGRMFAGGDSKMMIAFGAILPIFNDFSSNLKLYIVFLIVFMFSGAIYGLIYSMVLVLKNFKIFKKEFKKQFRKKKKIYYLIMAGGLAVIIAGIFFNPILYFGVLIFISPYLYLYAKAIEEACMIKDRKTSLLTEGDWLYKDVKVGKSWIRKNFEGLTKEDIKKLKKKYSHVMIKEGIPFSPTFIISLIIIIATYLLGINLWNSFW